MKSPRLIAAPLLRIAAFTIVLALLSAGQEANAQVSPLSALTRQSDPHVVRAGDEVRIGVFQKPDLGGNLVVTADGSLAHPLYRDVRVTGMTRAQVDSLIGRRLREVEGNVPYSVDVLHRVAVDGSVRSPGFHLVRSDATLAQSITEAGGGTDNADLRQVQVTRNGARAVVDMTAASDEVSRFTMRSGDAVFVPRRRAPISTYIGPAASVIAMLVSLANLLTR